MDDVGQMHFAAGDGFAERAAGDGDAGQIEQVLHLRPSARAGRRHRRNPPSDICPDGVILAITGTCREIASKRAMSSATPTRRAMAMTWMMALVEPPSAMCTLMALSKAAGGKNLLRRQILPHHVDDAAAGGGAHAQMVGVDGRDRRRAGQRHAERFGDRHHGGGGAHHHAGAEASAKCRPRSRPTPCRRCGRRAFRPSISRRRSPSPASRRASCRAASARPAHRSPECPC